MTVTYNADGAISIFEPTDAKAKNALDECGYEPAEDACKAVTLSTYNDSGTELTAECARCYNLMYTAPTADAPTKEDYEKASQQAFFDCEADATIEDPSAEA